MSFKCPKCQHVSFTAKEKRDEEIKSLRAIGGNQMTKEAKLHCWQVTLNSNLYIVIDFCATDALEAVRQTFPDEVDEARTVKIETILGKACKRIIYLSES